MVELSRTSPLTEIVRHHARFTAVLPDETRQFAVLLEPVPSDSAAIGRAQIAGICPALVNVGATTDQWAYVASGLDVLQGDRFWGDVRILSTPAGTGERLVWVQIQESPQQWYGKADEEIVQDATGTVSIWLGDPPADTTFNITGCLNWTGVTVSSGARCLVKRIGRTKVVEPLECES